MCVNLSSLLRMTYRRRKSPPILPRIEKGSCFKFRLDPLRLPEIKSVSFSQYPWFNWPLFFLGMILLTAFDLERNSPRSFPLARCSTTSVFSLRVIRLHCVLIPSFRPLLIFFFTTYFRNPPCIFSLRESIHFRARSLEVPSFPFHRAYHG